MYHVWEVMDPSPSLVSEDNQGSTVAHVPTPLRHRSAVAIGLSLHMVCLETMNMITRTIRPARPGRPEDVRRRGR